MKTETSDLLHYSASPLKVIETDNKDKAWLKVLKQEDTPGKQRLSIITNYSINNPGAWDASWFGNYE